MNADQNPKPRKHDCPDLEDSPESEYYGAPGCDEEDEYFEGEGFGGEGGYGDQGGYPVRDPEAEEQAEEETPPPAPSRRGGRRPGASTE